MKKYPSIIPEVINETIYAFDKLDGSNVRAEWSRKRGFYKFGSRKRLVGADEEFLGKIHTLIPIKYGELEKIAKKNRWAKAVFFFEFHGPGSFAGRHLHSEEQIVTLIDVAVDNKGIIPPRNFLKLFGDLDHAQLLYHGNANSIFEESVRDGSLEGMTFEGVVCKGRMASPGLPLMFKIKNRAWLSKLRGVCNGDESLFKDLA